MPSIPSLAAAIFVMPSLVFWPLLALLLLCDFFTVTREEDHFGWVTFFTLAAVAFFALHVRPSLWTVGIYFVGHMIFGLFYTSWRTRVETLMYNHRATAFLEAMLATNIKGEWPCHFRFDRSFSPRVNETARTDFDFIFSKVYDRTFESPEALRNALLPSAYLASFVGRLVTWTLLWPVFLGGDLTLGLFKNLKRLFLTTLSGWFKGIINRNFKVALPTDPRG